ncbi:hypothetical protein VNO77_27897 [Canavalia gladiata]|uniref:Uncharacterized protein n=1 Tax=Canavalia gladiata TaxID=3824 RepID=A0AAN9Q7H2_CANGL
MKQKYNNKYARKLKQIEVARLYGGVYSGFPKYGRGRKNNVIKVGPGVWRETRVWQGCGGTVQGEAGGHVRPASVEGGVGPGEGRVRCTRWKGKGFLAVSFAFSHQNVVVCSVLSVMVVAWETLLLHHSTFLRHVSFSFFWDGFWSTPSHSLRFTYVIVIKNHSPWKFQRSCFIPSCCLDGSSHLCFPKPCVCSMPSIH